MRDKSFLLSTISRRGTLAALAGGAFLASMPMRVLAHNGEENDVFRHGVASGDPDHGSVVLWTRITTDKLQGAGPQEVRWQLARDRAFTMMVKEGVTKTDAARDYTVKLLADGLEAGQIYYYRFLLGDAASPIGRARTLPDGHIERLGIALVSCSNFAFGFFNAYDAMASDANIDFVLHTGDYIYEYGQDGWGDDIARTLGRRHEPANEIVSLADYRMRHAQYKTDQGSQAMHAAHTFMACWDDHESANNPWKGGAQNHQGEKEGDWAMRRAASIQAYFEYMPIREPEWTKHKSRSRMEFWRSYSFGDLAMLHTLETRHTARALQIDYSEYKDKIKSWKDAAHLAYNIIGAPDRPMLSGAMEGDLNEALKASVASGQPWRLIGNPMPIARTLVPDVVALGVIADPASQEKPLDAAKELAWKGKWNLPFYPDTWDGYEWARERLYDLSRKAGAGDLIFLTGDSHSFWANSLTDKAGRAAGIELGTAGVSSPGDFASSGFDDALSKKLDQALIDHNPEIIWTDNMHQGYVRLDLTHKQGKAHFIAVDTVLSPHYSTSTIKRFALQRDKGAVQLV